MYRFICGLFLALLCQAVLAETCPTVAQIKTHLAKDWKAFDSDDGAPLSFKREIAFKKNIKQFILAEWSQINKKGTIHCYYRDKNGSNLEAYLAKDNFIPRNINNYWYSVSGLRQCAAGHDKCHFASLTKSTHLARR